ncbi:phage holin [Lactococcus lactis]|nr:phage holin [Lactococcus lactis]
MNQINWKLRLKSKAFWLALLPALFLLIQAIGASFGYKWNFVILNQQLAAVVNAAFALLAIVGVVADPTTSGLGDSDTVLNKDKSEENK